MFSEEDQEILDVVNGEDKIIGTINRKDMMLLRERPGEYLHVIEIFLQRPNGDIYLPRRSPYKKIAPGGYDHSAAGHILSGESYDDACIREVKEELGIDIRPEDTLIFIKKISPSPELFYFRMFYLLRTDQTPLLSPEHTDFSWIAPDDLERVVNDDIPTKETLHEDIPILLEYLRSETR